jgi:hypothetical protein
MGAGAISRPPVSSPGTRPPTPSDDPFGDSLTRPRRRPEISRRFPALAG